MNTKVIISVVIALVLLGGGAFVVLNKPSSTDNSQPTTNNSETNNPQSLRDLFASAIAQTCTFSDTSSGASGTVYVNAGKVRGDFEVTVDSTTTTNHMIMMDNTIYFWQQGSTDGFKTPLIVPTGGSDTSTSNQVDLDQQANYSCTPGIADQSKFNLPSDVTFTDPSSMIQEALGASGAPKIDCSACDSVPEGTARTQCLTALKCN